MNIFQSHDKYVLPMFMYTSGKVHMGHIRAFAVSDAISNLLTIGGKRVFQPIAWDSFGLPTENAAKIQNIDPLVWTQDNIAKMRKQILQFNFSFFWNAEFSTCDQSYYKWDQKIFCDLWNDNLIYEGEKEMPFCISCDTVLAREQSINDKCWRCDNIVEQRNTKQIFIRNTAFAERLYKDLAFVDCTKRFLDTQRAWLGDVKKQYAVYKNDNLLGYIYVSDAEIKQTLSIDVVESNQDVYLHSTSELEQIIVHIRTSANKSDFIVCNTVKNNKNTIFSCKLEDWCVSRQRKWGTPIPLVDCKNCGLYALLSDEFSLEKQHDKNIICSKCQNNALKYDATLDTLYTSSWYMYRYTDSNNDKKEFENINKCPFVDYYIGGIEHATGHHVYARFMHKFFLSKGKVSSLEPFGKIVNQALVLGQTFKCSQCGKYFNTQVNQCDKCSSFVAAGYQKMSKSKLNGLDPLKLLEKYDSDTLKMHLLYLSPATKDIEWSENGIAGMSKLLKQIEYLCQRRQTLTLNTVCNCVKSSLVATNLHNMYQYLLHTIEKNFFSINVAMTTLFTTLPYLKKTVLCSCDEFEKIANMYLLLLYVFAPCCANKCYEKLFDTHISNKIVFEEVYKKIVNSYTCDLTTISEALSLFSIDNTKDINMKPDSSICKYDCEVLIQ